MKQLITGPGCANCEIAKQYIEENNLPIPIINIESDEGKELMSNFPIRGIPTLLETEDGKEIGRQVGKIDFK